MTSSYENIYIYYGFAPAAGPSNNQLTGDWKDWQDWLTSQLLTGRIGRTGKTYRTSRTGRVLHGVSFGAQSGHLGDLEAPFWHPGDRLGDPGVLGDTPEVT